jgi:hypothetical protein
MAPSRRLGEELLAGNAAASLSADGVLILAGRSKTINSH